MHGGYGVNNEYRQDTESQTDASEYSTKHEDVLEVNKLAAFIYFTCQGHLFMQAGEEFGRTKFGDGNSYRSDPAINMLRWHQTVEFSDLLEYYKGLISLRKKLPGLCDKTADASKRILDKKVQKEKVVSFVVDNTETSQLFVVYNAGNSETTVKIPEGEWVVLADKNETDCRKKASLTKDGELIVDACCGMMLEKIK